MHDHDHDLIAAIAEGSLGSEDLRAARQSIAGCTSCQEELDLQSTALAALRGSPRPSLTGPERTRLHRAVERGLAPTAPRDHAVLRTPWYQRLMPVMAAAAALLVVVGVGSMLVGDGGGDESGDLALETTLAPTPTQRSQESAAAPPALADSEEAGAAEATTAAASEAAKDFTVLDLGGITSQDLPDVVRGRVIPGSDSDPDDLLSWQFDGAERLPFACTSQLPDGEDFQVFARAVVDGGEVEIYVVAGRAYVFEASTCTLIDTID